MFSADEHVAREACIETRCMSAHTRVACPRSLRMFKSGLRLLNTTKCRVIVRSSTLKWYVTATLCSFRM